MDESTKKTVKPESLIKDIYTVRELAQKLGLSEITIRLAIKREQLTAKKIGRNLYITHQNLMEYMNRK